METPKTPLRIVGVPGSPYSRKLRAVLRYRRIAHIWILQGSPESRDLPRPRVALLPQLILPGADGKPEARVDTTPLIRELETLYPGRSAIPPDHAMKFIDELIEDYGDEWLTKAMFHYRWAYPPDIDQAAALLPRWSRTDLPEEKAIELGRMFSERQIGRLAVVGSNPTTAKTIEDSYRRLLSLLDAHLTQFRFVMGGRPGAGDFALYGQLTQLADFDPTPSALALQIAPRVVAWVQVMDDLSGLEPTEKDWITSDAVPETLRALLKEIGRVYIPFLLANADAVARGAEQVECEIDGAPWVQRPFPYQAKCLNWLRESYGALAKSDRARLDSILNETGCGNFRPAAAVATRGSRFRPSARRLLQLAIVVAVLALAGWLAFDQIILRLPGIIDGIKHPTGPHREIDWDQGPAAAAQLPGQRPPNIVVIVADDLGWNDLTFAGGGVAGSDMPTPNIDSIARDGVRFMAGYSASGTCAASRAAIMSGRYPTRFGFEFTPTPKGMGSLVNRFYDRPGILRRPLTFPERGEELPFQSMGMPPSEITLAELLRSAGYHTVHIGKWHLGDVDGMAPHEQGFDESLMMASGKYLPDGHPEVVNSHQDFDPIDKFLWPTMKYAASFNGSPRFEPRGYLTNYYTEEAIKVIEANRNRPFFLYLAHWAPHTPLQAWKADYDALDSIADPRRRVYAAMIRALDRGVGQVLEALRVNGLEDNTLVVFTSDNGGAGYIGLDGVNDPFRGWKITFFEGGIHVPFFMKWPARLGAGAVYSEPIHHFDIYATAAAAAGAALPSDRPMDGVDVVPYVNGALGVPHRALFWRGGHYQVALADGWKLQVTERPKKTWLFHLAGDPTEQRNLAAERPDKVRELEALLAAHNAEQAKSAWPSLVEFPVSIDKTLAEPESADDEYIYWPN